MAEFKMGSGEVRCCFQGLTKDFRCKKVVKLHWNHTSQIGSVSLDGKVLELLS